MNRSYRDVALVSWEVDNQDVRHIQLACLRQLIDEVRALKDSLCGRLDSLGSDGIHYILNDERKRRERMRLTEIKKRSAAKKKARET